MEGRQASLNNLQIAKLYSHLSWKHAFLIYLQLIMESCTLKSLHLLEAWLSKC